MKHLLCISLLLIFSINIGNLLAQDPSTKGDDFWFTFMPNEHLDDNIHQFIVMADSPTSVTYTKYRNTDSIVEVININNSDMTLVYTLSGFWALNEIAYALTQHTSRMSYRLESDKPVQMLLVNHSKWSTDASIILPVHGLGKEHLVQSYESADFYASQYCVIAVEDGTELLIQHTKRNNNKIEKIKLNKSEVFYQRTDVRNDPIGDLTGTLLNSNKGVSVFSGHKRAHVPRSSEGSYDHLITNVLPTEFGGLEYLTFPLREINQDPNFSEDEVRIISFEDNSEISLNGSITQDVIDKGEYIAYPLIKSFYLTSNKPTSCYQIKHSGGNARQGIVDFSDPFLMSIPAFEQYANKYDFYSFNVRDGLFREHHISVVISEEGLKSLYLDGQFIGDDVSPEPTLKDGYVFFNYQLQEGRHSIESEERFCCVVYGYGAADSYGYAAAGFKLIVIDPSPPTDSSGTDCNKVNGIMKDDAINDSGIAKINLSDSKNIKLDYDRSQQNSHKIEYTASLIDKYSDGHYYLQSEAPDGSKYSYERVNIEGFTLKLKGSNPEQDMPNYDDTLALDDGNCLTFAIENYGKYDKDNILVQLVGSDKFEITTSIDSLNSKQIDSITICYKADFDPGLHQADLIIQNDCDERIIARFSIYSQEDTLAPLVEKSINQCQTQHSFSFSDETYFDQGIDSVFVRISDNCSVIISDSLLPDKLDCAIKIINEYQDAIYEIDIIDIRNNIKTIRDTIPGYTIAYDDALSSTISFDGITDGFQKCKTITMVNYGYFPITFNSSHVFENRNFSLPNSQFPLTVNPADTMALQICFMPSRPDSSEFDDAFRLDFNCLKTILYANGVGLDINAHSSSECEISLFINTKEVPSNLTSLAISPNPATNFASIVIGNPREQLISISIYDNFGNKMSDVYQGKVNAGYYNFEFEFDDLHSGIYFYLIKSSDEFISNKFVIIE